MHNQCLIAIGLGVCALVLTACPRKANVAAASGGGENGAAPGAPVITDRIDVPADVRQNLGITFVKAERRAISATRRYPGVFEWAPEAVREIRAPIAGYIVASQAPLQVYDKAVTLFELDIPVLHELKARIPAVEARRNASAQSVQQARAAVKQAEAAAVIAQQRVKSLQALTASAETHEAALKAEAEHWEKRVGELEKLLASGAGVASELADARGRALEARREHVAAIEEHVQHTANAEQARLDAESSALGIDAARTEIGVREAAFQAVDAEIDEMVNTSIAPLGEWGRTAATLQRNADGSSAWVIDARPLSWGMGGRQVVLNIASAGTRVAEGDLIARVAQADAVVFRASAPQADLAGLLKAKSGNLVLAAFALQGEPPVSANIAILPEADAGARTVALRLAPHTRPAWAIPGVTAHAEIEFSGTADPVIALPLRAVIRDGLEDIAFVRDPKDPNKVIRRKVSLGANDGRWVHIESGIGPESEVVLDGIYELKLASAKNKPEGPGHFHSDGTWHAGADHH